MGRLFLYSSSKTRVDIIYIIGHSARRSATGEEICRSDKIPPPMVQDLNLSINFAKKPLFCSRFFRISNSLFWRLALTFLGLN